ncbi:MAG: hypothetical protein AB1432_03450 [Bacteroidota bacterium]
MKNRKKNNERNSVTSSERREFIKKASQVTAGVTLGTMLSPIELFSNERMTQNQAMKLNEELILLPDGNVYDKDGLANKLKLSMWPECICKTLECICRKFSISGCGNKIIVTKAKFKITKGGRKIPLDKPVVAYWEWLEVGDAARLVKEGIIDKEMLEHIRKL